MGELQLYEVNVESKIYVEAENVKDAISIAIDNIWDEVHSEDCSVRQISDPASVSKKWEHSYPYSNEKIKNIKGDKTCLEIATEFKEELERKNGKEEYERKNQIELDFNKNEQ